MRRYYSEYDLAIVGASFAGLAAAAIAAARDLKVVVLEAKPRSGARVHTTGLLVKEASQELEFPSALTKKIHGVRLYSPNLNYVDLSAPGYYFFATDTDALLDWMALRARDAGATILTNTPFRHARICNGLVNLDPPGICAKFVIGADGPLSRVARVFNLGTNRFFLRGVEAEFPFVSKEDDVLHCFLDGKLAPGYLGWTVPGIGVRQIGLAVKQKSKPDLGGFIKKISPVTGAMSSTPAEIRGGLIPCGGVVAPFAGQHALLVGDAAGLVSPLTGGGIHRALYFGRKAALSVCDFLKDGGDHPAIVMAREYPSFFGKRLMRSAIDLNVPNAVYNSLLSTKMFRSFARTIFFHSRGGSAERELCARSRNSRFSSFRAA
jgi:digeranylgeranylglycerophospholipid reductase